MRIAHFISRKSCRTGGGIQALLLAKALSSLGHKVFFVSRGGDCERRAVGFGISHFRLNLKGNMDVSSFGKFYSFLKKKNIEVVHCHKGLALSVALFSKVVMDFPVKIFANRGVSFSLDVFNRWKYKIQHTNGVVVVCYNLAHELAKRDGINPEKIKVLYGSVASKFFRRIPTKEARCKLKLPQKDNIICLVGNFRPWKGHIFLARSLLPVMEKDLRLKLLFAGKEKKDILGEVKSLIGGRFTSLGYREDVEYVIAASDLLLNVSSEGEGLPGVVREAMCLGKAVVVTDVAGNKEIVRHAKTGVIIKVGDERALRKFVCLLLENPALRLRMGINARKVSAIFDEKYRALRAVRIYESL